MFLSAVLFAQLPAHACSQTPPSLVPESREPRAGEPLWMYADRAVFSLGFVVEVDGVEVTGETRTFGLGGSAYVSFTPDVPFEEGNEVRVVVDPAIAFDTGGHELEPVTMVVDAAAAVSQPVVDIDAFELLDVVPAETDSCGGTDEYRDAPTSVSWTAEEGPLRMLVVDDETDEVLLILRSSELEDSVDFDLRAPPDSGDVCIRVDALLSDGSIVSSPSACAADDQGAIGGCSTGGLGAAWLSALLVLPLVRRRD